MLAEVATVPGSYTSADERRSSTYLDAHLKPYRRREPLVFAFRWMGEPLNVPGKLCRVKNPNSQPYLAAFNPNGDIVRAEIGNYIILDVAGNFTVYTSLEFKKTFEAVRD